MTVQADLLELAHRTAPKRMVCEALLREHDCVARPCLFWAERLGCTLPVRIVCATAEEIERIMPINNGMPWGDDVRAMLEQFTMLGDEG